MKPVLKEVFNRGFFRAIALGGVVAVVGAAAVALADLPEAWGWAVFLLSLFIGSLADREGFYGTPPRQRH